MKLKLLIGLLVLLGILVACQQQSKYNIEDNVEEEATLFTEEDIDNAILQLSDTLNVIKVNIDYQHSHHTHQHSHVTIPGDSGEVDSSQNNDLSTLLNVNNLSGYVCNIINNTNGRNKWRIQSVNAADESVLGLFAVKQDGRAIQSIGCNSQGNKAVFSMKTSSISDYEVFLLDFSGHTRHAYQLTSNGKNDIDVSMSNDGNTIVWQSWLGSDKVITIRQYAADGSYSDTVLDGPVPYVEPTINSDGTLIAFLDIRNNQSNILKHNLNNGNTVSLHNTSGKRSLAHPSISNDGQRIAWMDGANDENFKVKDLATNTITEIVTNNPNLDHGFLADDGTSVVYSINRDDKAFTKVKNIDDGITKNVGRVLSPPARYRGSSWVVTNDYMEVALNERLELLLSSYGSQALTVTASNGYIATIIQQTSNSLIFDIKLDDNVALTDDSDLVEITVTAANGVVVAKQTYKVTSIFASPEVVVSTEGLTKDQLRTALSGTSYTFLDSDFDADSQTALINIGNATSETALLELFNIINAAAPSSSQLQTQVGSGIRILAGPNFAYKPDRRSGRFLDPTCNIRNDLDTYAQNGGWDTIGNLSNAVGAPAAHQAGYTGQDVVVVFLDSGIYAATDEFDCPDTPEKELHGTYVRKVVQAIAPDILPEDKKIFNATGTATLDNLINTSSLIAALDDIAQEYLEPGDKKVILNMSFSAPIHSSHGHDFMLWSTLLEYYELYKDNLLIVTSAGNHGIDEDYSEEVFYPAGYSRSFVSQLITSVAEFDAIPNIISVGTAGRQNGLPKPTTFNPQHPAIDLLGYGVNICSANPNNPNCNSDYLVGSSFSTPVVSAIAALNWSQCSGLTSEQLISQLQATGQTTSGATQKLAKVNVDYNCGSQAIWSISGAVTVGEYPYVASEILSPQSHEESIISAYLYDAGSGAITATIPYLQPTTSGYVYSFENISPGQYYVAAGLNYFHAGTFNTSGASSVPQEINIVSNNISNIDFTLEKPMELDTANNSVNTNNILLRNISIHGSTTGSDDWFKILVPERMSLTFKTQAKFNSYDCGANGYANTILTLYDNNGILASNNDSTYEHYVNGILTTSSTKCSRISEYEFLQPGTYFIKVSATIGQDGDYVLTSY